MGCILREKTVIRGRSEAHTEYRCLNKACDLHRNIVDDNTCSECPFKKLKKAHPCTGKAPVGVPPPSDCPECGEQVEEQMKNYPDGFVKDVKKATLGRKVLNYSMALKRWIVAGRPTRNDEEVTKIHSICKKCDWYDKESASCKGCGCKVSENKIAVVNKIKMTTEHCPKELW